MIQKVNLGVSCLWRLA